jgi:phenylacetate-CoA ligase
MVAGPEARRRFGGHLPPDAAYGFTYARTRRFLARSEFWSRERLEKYQTERLRALLSHCGNHVPYYRELFHEVGFDPLQIAHPRDLRALPFLDKELLRANLDRLLADNVLPAKIDYSLTGGTTGVPLRIANLRGAGGRELAFIHTIWRRVGFRPTDRRAFLRGRLVPEPPHWSYEPYERARVYSNLYLTAETAPTFARAMLEHRDPFLHSYPSSLALFARYVKDQSLDLPEFMAVLTSSENLSERQREFIESSYRTRVFSWYGQSENVILAAQCEETDHYHVVPEYGATEVVRADGEPACEEGEEGELVGTTLSNYAMPLVRYRTGDWAVLGPRAVCVCGRQHNLLSRIVGRRSDEVLVGVTGNLIPLTALVDPYSPSFERVQRMQFRQERPGEVELRVVRRNGYSDGDTRNIISAMRELIGTSLDVHVTFCTDIPLTRAGKHRLLVQELPTR